MKTYKFWIFHVDRDYGIDGYWYIDDNKVYSHGYAPSFRAAAVNWIRNIPTAFAVRKTMASLDKKSKEQESRNAAR